MNPYEQACERFNEASAKVRAARLAAADMLREADENWEAARENLRQYEQSPGIPLPEYNAWISDGRGHYLGVDAALDQPREMRDE